MALKIKSISSEDSLRWNNFSNGHKFSCLYHLSNWRDILQISYRIGNYYLIASGSDEGQKLLIENDLHINTKNIENNDDKTVGIFPLIHINSLFFGNNLVSIPYFDSGGILVIDKLAEIALLKKSIQLAEELGVTQVEFRQNYRLLSFEDFINSQTGWEISTSMNKVRMVFDIPDNPELLMKSFNSKLRSQIRKPIKEGLTAKVGSIELIDDFYNIFAENMRDLGSPIHSKKFIAETLKAFPNTANVFIVYGNQKPLAGSVTIGFKDTLSNPWASALRRYSHLAPNMLLYWSMLEFACQQGYKHFDFGRSTLGEGTYRFKEQWGAKPEPLYWYRLSKTNGQNWGGQPDKDKMSKAIEYWKKLPVPLTKIIGPRIRKYISL